MGRSNNDLTYLILEGFIHTDIQTRVQYSLGTTYERFMEILKQLVREECLKMMIINATRKYYITNKGYEALEDYYHAQYLTGNKLH